MGKLNEFRFSIQLDATDESHRKVAAYLNGLGRKKGRVIAKALLAYMKAELEGQETSRSIVGSMLQQNAFIEEKDKFGRMLSINADRYSFGKEELDLM